MEQLQAGQPKVSEAEVTRVFEELNLETQEERDAVLRQEITKKSGDPSKVRYITRLSNSTKAAPTA